jgi:tripartite-type tricarboxylate transporter receptor subunit TctC
MNLRPSRLVAAAIALGAAALALPAQAVDIPCRVAKLIVPWKPGGDTDIIFRLFVDIANKEGAKPKLQVVNVSGEGGNRGAKEVHAAAPNGCTLLAIHDSAIISYLAHRVNFTWNAFEPVASITYTPSVIGASPAVSYDDMKGLVAYAKAHPGQITAGVTLGSTSQFIFLLIEDAAGIKLKYVPYEGTRERLTAMLAKNVDLGEMNILTAKQYIQQGSLKALGIATEKRSDLIPDIPTLKEQGVDVVYGLTRGIVLPKGTPQAIVKHYEQIAAKAAHSHEFDKAMHDKGTLVEYRDASQYRAFDEKSFKQYERLAKKVGM